MNTVNPHVGSTSRRGFVTLVAGVGAAAAVGTGRAAGSPRRAGEDAVVLRSRAAVPDAFAVPLPIPPVADPVCRDGDTDYYEIEQREAAVAILPGAVTTVWGYDGMFPGPTIAARSGRRVVVTMRNRLPVPTVTHVHGSVTPPESDGYPTDLVPSGDERTYEYPLGQRAATLWYHDHRMDYTAPQIWRGLLGVFLVHDDEDDALSLPRGDRDVPLLLCDRSFDADGSFLYPALDPRGTGDQPGVRDEFAGGVLGDVQLVNGAPWPELAVAAGRYRFRLVNGSNARSYLLALCAGDSGPAAVFTQIGSDGGLLAAPVEHDGLAVSPGERFDVVVDFSGYPVGSHVTMLNTLGAGRMGQVMRFVVTSAARDEQDDARVPDRLSTLALPSAADAVAVRTFDFRRTEGSGGHAMWTINGRPFDVDETLAEVGLGTVERWRFRSDGHHPVHLHMAHFRVLSRDGHAPAASDAGWKDTVDLRPREVVDVLVRFDGYRGRYVLHCHNLEHEDMAMMANFDVV
ncbi:multicopper oxidase domain-containing protein [Streptomyces sp. SID3343]|uniref:multicopper oxidase family protein n=1 Tax=Streptomyces sp. SID3343 TaxID=2690260 RepID=UPI0031F78737